MTATTSLKLPADLKKTIAKVAAFEGKTAHALMVDTFRPRWRMLWYANSFMLTVKPLTKPLWAATRCMRGPMSKRMSWPG